MIIWARSDIIKVKLNLLKYSGSIINIITRDLYLEAYLFDVTAV